MPTCPPAFRLPVLLFALTVSSSVGAQDFEEAVVDVGNVGLTVTNVGFVGKASVRSNPTGPPSFEYPLNSGVEHLFESGLWVAARRSDGVTTVRSGATTNSAGYQPGRGGYEFTPASIFSERSTLPESPAFTRQAISHQDYRATFVDTAAVLPGTQIPAPDPGGRLGISVTMTTHAWNFPFTEYFVILNYDIVNISDAPWDSVYVGMWHDLVVRNVNTTTETGGAFFNKGGLGSIDSLMTSYAFNAGGVEESINTYGAVVILGAEWRDPRTGQRRFVTPELADEFVADGYAPPAYNPRWWLFSGNPDPELARPSGDEERFRRMAIPYPDPQAFATEEEFEAARAAWVERLRTDGQIGQGNWIGLSALGPFHRVEPGDTLRASFAMVAARKPDDFQNLSARTLDTPETRAILAENIRWARRTFAGEDNNYNGRLDPGEDVNANGRLDRYLIPEPPAPPKLRVELEAGRAVVYWDRTAEESRDPVTGETDFEGYRIYRSNPGDDLSGDVIGRATLVAQYDRTGNRSGFNNGFGEVALSEPVTFPDDPTPYHYRFTADGLLSGWQYAFSVTAFDEGDDLAGLPSFESSRTANATRVFPGTPPAADGRVGVYPNPYRVGAAWDGGTSRTRRLNFYNLPARSAIRVYTLTGEIVAEMEHDAATYQGDIRWYDDFAGADRLLPGGEHSWDLLSESGLSLSTGLYLFSVKDLDSGDVQTGKFAVIK